MLNPTVSLHKFNYLFIEKPVLASEAVQKWSEGKAPKKVIIVPGKIVNIVL